MVHLEYQDYEQKIKSFHKHGIHYWSFSATSTKKANVYEKLLKRWMTRNTMAFKYDRVGNDFYVYVENNFND